MKMNNYHLLILFSLLLLGCGEKETKKEGFSVERQKSAIEQKVEVVETNTVKPSERIDLSNKGIGPIKSLTLNAEIDQAMAAEGKTVYDQMCMACHRVGKKFIGPAPNGILERRSAEWVMNMILNPDVMVKEDPLAKELMQEFNGSPMANQGLTEAQARAVLEYFRTL
jgi:mono/diheme cytochrome c family protein